MDELDADHKMYHYVTDIVATLQDVMNGDAANIEGALYHALEIQYYLETMMEVKITFIEGPK
jgi:hypothetical protein